MPLRLFATVYAQFMLKSERPDPSMLFTLRQPLATRLTLDQKSPGSSPGGAIFQIQERLWFNRSRFLRLKNTHRVWCPDFTRSDIWRIEGLVAWWHGLPNMSKVVAVLKTRGPSI
jgi:hypothetical protein